MLSVVKKKLTVIGLMSGTSHDGVDAAITSIRQLSSANPDRIPDRIPHRIDVKLIRHLHVSYSKSLRNEISRSFNGNTELICGLNFKLGEVFARAVLSALKASAMNPNEIDAIASHGQTVYHIPPSRHKMGSTLQIGEPAVIAARTGILTISNFRTGDMAAGGQGAPLVPLTDYLLFHKKGRRIAVLNIGGIANVTILRDSIDDIAAFDIGPGNSLIDEAVKMYDPDLAFDNNGDIAKSGMPIEQLLKELLSHRYFKKTPPKSTGRETFGKKMVEDILMRYADYPFEDVLSTFTHLTAITVFNSVLPFKPDEIILTGGGLRNIFMNRLINNLFAPKGIAVKDVSIYGIPYNAKEAVSFAILGYLTLKRLPGNLPSVTGADRGVILGNITLP